ncbi:hypothetical protein OIV83_004979 [Microbotryomycetes sp. JL201]|nr:hypothetical protein OIV83_004979 [Microbotryomycetes sp. JL201]
MSRRAFSTASRLAQEAFSSARRSVEGSSKARLARTKDPLSSSTRAEHYVLEGGNRFIVRPPPSTLPPILPVPSTSSSSSPTDAPSGSVNATAAFAAAFIAPSTSRNTRSIFGLDQLSETPSFEHLLPPTRKTASGVPRKLSDAQVAELQQLRRSDPAAWTRSKLAAKFGISANAVGTLGFGKGMEAKVAAQARQLQVEQAQARREQRWGWKKQIARQERRSRRAEW